MLVRLLSEKNAMNLKLFAISTCLLTMMCACNSDDGKGDVPNFPTQTVSFPSDGGERILHSTNSINWSFGRIGIYAADAEFPTIKYYFETDEEKGVFFKDINGGKRNIVSTYDFEIVKVDKNKMLIKMNPGKERVKALIEVWGTGGGDTPITIPLERVSVD